MNSFDISSMMEIAEKSVRNSTERRMNLGRNYVYSVLFQVSLPKNFLLLALWPGAR